MGSIEEGEHAEEKTNIEKASGPRCPRCDQMVTGKQQVVDDLTNQVWNAKLGCVVSEFPPSGRFHMDASSVIFYGGYLICESVSSEKYANLIAAAPLLLAALENFENDDGSIPAKIWELRNKAIAKARGESYVDKG